MRYIGLNVPGNFHNRGKVLGGEFKKLAESRSAEDIGQKERFISVSSRDSPRKQKIEDTSLANGNQIIEIPKIVNAVLVSLKSIGGKTSNLAISEQENTSPTRGARRELGIVTSMLMPRKS